MKILLIDADDSEYGIVKQILTATLRTTFEFSVVSSVNEASKVMWDQTFDLILLDAELNSDFAMMDARSIIKAHARGNPIIMLSEPLSKEPNITPKHDNFFQAVDKYSLQTRLSAYLKTRTELKKSG